MTMRIGVDAAAWLNRRGYGRFTRNVVRQLVERDEGTTYVLYLDEPSANEAEGELPAAAEVRLVHVRRAPAQAAAAGRRRSLGDVARFSAAATRARHDAFLFPSVYTYFPVVATPAVVGVHDAIADTLPELTLAGPRDRLLWRAKEWLAVRTACRLFTVSEAARTDLSRRLRLPPGRIAVVPEAPDPAFFPRATAEIERELGPLGLAGRPFLLYAGGISPHKNLGTLLEAYHALRGRIEAAPPLAIAGALDGDAYLSAATDVREGIERLGLGDAVRLTGFVSDAALACLYSAATLVVLPSLAEGFGLPAVEAAACGAPLVLSDLPAHRESLGDGAVYVAPRDAAGLAGELERLLHDDDERRLLAERGRKAVASLSWDAAADRLRALIAVAARR